MSTLGQLVAIKLSKGEVTSSEPGGVTRLAQPGPVRHASISTVHVREYSTKTGIYHAENFHC